MFNFYKPFAATLDAARIVRRAVSVLTLVLVVGFGMLVGISSFTGGIIITAQASSDPVPDVTLSVPNEVLIGEDFTFTVTFKNTGGAIGYGPYIDLYLPAWGADGNAPFTGTGAPQKCDGIDFVRAEALFTNPPTVALAPKYKSEIDGNPPCPTPYTHPFLPGATVLGQAPSGNYQLVVLELPFGSFDQNQPEITVRVTAHISDFADADTPLTIYARGGFRYGADALNNHPADPLIESSPPVFAPTTPAIFTLKKAYLGPEGPENWEAVAGPNFIDYYPLKYQITVDIAEGQSIHDLIITDSLSNDLQFAGNVSVAILGDAANPVGCQLDSSSFPVDIAMPSTSMPGGTLTVTLCNPIEGKAMPDDVVITFEFYVPKSVLDESCGSSPVLVKNDVIATGKWESLDPRDSGAFIISDVTTEDHILQAKCLAVQKSVRVYDDKGAAGPTPDDILEYTLKFQLADYHTIGKIVITDWLMDGQEFIVDDPAPLLTIQDQFGSHTGVPIFPVPNDAVHKTCPPGEPPQGAKNLEFDISGALAAAAEAQRHQEGILTGGLATDSASETPAFGQLVFYALITDQFAYPQQPGDPYVDKHDPIKNCVEMSAVVFQNEPADRAPTEIIGDARDSSASQVTIVTNILEKTVYAVKRGTEYICGPSGSPCSNLPGSPQEVRPGDQVTFRIKYSIPSGDAENVVIDDWLPLPIFVVENPDANLPWTCPSTAIPAPGSAGCGPGHTAPAPTLAPLLTENGIRFTYGTIFDTDNQPKQIDLLFTMVVTHQPFADGLDLTNETRECEDNTFGVRFCQIAIAQVNVREPKLAIGKGVIATNNTFGVVTPAPLTAGLPVGTPPGVSPAAPPRFTPPINSNNLAGFIGRDLSNVDADDWVTYAISIENTGGAPAYDIKLEDIIPLDAVDAYTCFEPDFDGLSVTYGNGTAIPFTTAPGGPGHIIITLGLPLDPKDSMTALTGTNIAIITFEAQLLDKDRLKSGCCDNRAELIRYTSAPGEIQPNFVDAGFGGPFADAAKVCVGPRAYKKGIQATSEVHTTPQNADQLGTAGAAIGEIVRFRLVTVIPEGTTLNFQIRDFLPVGLTYIGNPSVVFVTNMGTVMTPPSSYWPTVTGDETTHGIFPGPPFAISSPPMGGGPFDFGTGQDPIFFVQPSTDLTQGFNIHNPDNDPNLELAIIEFNAQVDNSASNQNNTVLTDQFQVRFKDEAGHQFISDSGMVDVRIVEPNLTLTKTANPTTVMQGTAAPVTYNVNLKNTGTAAAFDVYFADTLPPGLALVNPLLPVSGCTIQSVSPGNVTVTCAKLEVGLTKQITYQATVTGTVPCSTTLTNTARITWTSLPGPKGTAVNPTGQQTVGPSGAAAGERNGSISYPPFPPASPNPPNDYVATASATVGVTCPPGIALICVTKFCDRDGNGTPEPGDQGLGGWVIKVVDVSGVPIPGSPFKTKDGGTVCFIVSAPATYTISEEVRPNWYQTTPVTPDTYTVSVSANQAITTGLSFGNRRTGGDDPCEW